MTTPQQFLEAFLREKTVAWAQARPHLITVYAKYFGEPLSQHAERFMPRDAVRAVVEDVRQSDGVASAVTREHFKSADIRTRYRLAALGRVGRSSAWIASVSCVAAPGRPGIHDARSVVERDGMNQAETPLLETPLASH